MKAKSAGIYRCPVSNEELTLEVAKQDGDEIIEGTLQCPSGHVFPIVNGIPRLLDIGDLQASDQTALEDYNRMARGIYDAGTEWLFKSFFEDEDEVRGHMLDFLEIKPGARILEIGAGTCRDSILIAPRLDGNSTLYLQDLSANMLEVGRDNLAEAGITASSSVPIEYVASNASNLPFPDQFFDAVFHFGGINTFSDIKQTFEEITRVVRIGGKVVVGDESVPPWLRDTSFGKILLNTNSLYAHVVPLSSLPERAADVCLRWVLGNAFYLIDYRVAENGPQMDLDLPIPGKRGGTHRSRYFGQIEGVTVETKSMIEAAANASGLSLHDWIDRAIRERADLESQG